MELPSWYRILEACRRLSEPFGSIELAAACKSPKLDAHSASGWLSKFVRWGYVAPAGSRKAKGHPASLFTLTVVGDEKPKPKTLRGTRTVERRSEK